MKKTLLTLLALVLTVVVGSQVANAIGSLIPSGTAGDDTQYSLNDIYDKLVSFSDTPTSTSSPFLTPGTLTTSFHTLREIYDLLTAENSDLVPENIAEGITIFGIEGNLISGEGGAFEWSTNQGTHTHPDAISVCANLVEGSHDDWRLPEIHELIAAITSDWSSVSGNPLFIDDESYWSNTLVSDGSAWRAIKYAGIYATYSVLFDSIGNTYQVVCVR